MNNLYPEQSSTSGFLANGEILEEIINQDEKTLKKLNITTNQIADKLETITEKFIRKRNLYYRENHLKNENFDYNKTFQVDNLNIKITRYLGYQHCPFGCPEENSDSDFDIINLKNKTKLFFSLLHIHLIRKHHFFEGNTKYRLDPKQTIQCLEIKPNINYKPTYQEETIWNKSGGFCQSQSTIQDYLKNNYYLNSFNPIENITDFPIKNVLAQKINEKTILIISEQNIRQNISYKEIPFPLGISNGCFEYQIIKNKFVE